MCNTAYWRTKQGFNQAYRFEHRIKIIPRDILITKMFLKVYSIITTHVYCLLKYKYKQEIKKIEFSNYKSIQENIKWMENFSTSLYILNERN